jgi:hypothetical protein
MVGSGVRASSRFIVLLLVILPASAMNFSSVFGDSMVLQRDVQAAVYGMASAGETIKVTLSSNGMDEAPAASVAASDGSWKVLLPVHEAGGNYTVLASGSSGASAVLVSDVDSSAKPLFDLLYARRVLLSAICGFVQDRSARLFLSPVLLAQLKLLSFQSNMELGLQNTLTRNDSYAALKAGKYPNIRIAHFNHNPLVSAIRDHPDTCADHASHDPTARSTIHHRPRLHC